MHLLLEPKHYDSLSKSRLAAKDLCFSPVETGNPKHREYDMSANDLIRILHKFIARIKQGAPPTIRYHAIFEILHAHPIKTILESTSF